MDYGLLDGFADEIDRPLGRKAIGALFDFLTGQSLEQIAAVLRVDVPCVERLLRYALVKYGFSAKTTALSAPPRE